MHDDIKINLGDGTTIPSVEGAPAIAVLADHRMTKNGDLVLRYRFEAAGDDALHAGNVEVKVKITRPDNSEPGDGKTTAEANAIGAHYALGFVEVAQRILGESLVKDFEGAVSGALKPDTDPAIAGLADTCAQIAMMLLLRSGFDADKAKEASALITSPEWAGRAAEVGLSPEDVEAGRGLICAAIDHIVAKG